MSLTIVELQISWTHLFPLPLVDQTVGLALNSRWWLVNLLFFEWRYYTLCWLRWKNTHRKYQFSHQNYLAFNSSAHFAPSCGALSEGFGLYYWPVLPLIPLESLTLINSKPLLHKFRQVVNYSYDCKAHSRLPLLLWLWGIHLTNERLMEKIRWEINALWFFFFRND